MRARDPFVTALLAYEGLSAEEQKRLVLIARTRRGGDSLLGGLREMAVGEALAKPKRAYHRKQKQETMATAVAQE